MTAKLYVASSWRNPYQPTIVALARELGLTTYDFRRPHGGDHDSGFSWRQIDNEPAHAWTYERYREILRHPIAEAAFQSDMAGLQADATLLVMPAGRSAHYELGYAVGRGQRCAVLYPVDLPMRDIGGHDIEGWACTVCHGPEATEHGERYNCRLRTKLRDDFEPELMVKGASDGILIGRDELRDWLQSIATVATTPRYNVHLRNLETFARIAPFASNNERARVLLDGVQQLRNEGHVTVDEARAAIERWSAPGFRL